jgi:hypothetical protein
VTRCRFCDRRHHGERCGCILSLKAALARVNLRTQLRESLKDRAA